jgi:hypothetical protein
MAVPPVPSPLRPAERSTSAPLLIPRTFHYVWLGGRPMPDEFVEFRRTWARHHPGWQIAVWDESTLPRLRNQHWFDQAETWSMKVDIASFELLHRHGGVYLDTDFECLRDIEPLLGGLDAFAASEDDVHVCHGIMGCIPGHPLFDRLVESVEHSITSQPSAAPSHTTGPHLVTKVFNAWAEEGQPAKVFGPALFYPYHYSEPHRRHEAFPDAYAAHHWAGSWLPENQPARRRLVLSADWDRAESFGPLLSLLATYCRLFGTADRVELMIVCAPGTDTVVAEIITQALGAVADVATLPELWIKTYDELDGEPSDLTMTVTGNAATDAVEVAEAAAWMAALRTELGPAPCP